MIIILEHDIELQYLIMEK